MWEWENGGSRLAGAHYLSPGLTMRVPFWRCRSFDHEIRRCRSVGVLVGGAVMGWTGGSRCVGSFLV